MSWLLLLIAGCALFAYIPIMLIIFHARRPKKLRDDLLKRYVEKDEISTEQYLAEVDKHWEDIKHMPL